MRFYSSGRNSETQVVIYLLVALTDLERLFECYTYIFGLQLRNTSCHLAVAAPRSKSCCNGSMHFSNTFRAAMLSHKSSFSCPQLLPLVLVFTEHFQNPENTHLTQHTQPKIAHQSSPKIASPEIALPKSTPPKTTPTKLLMMQFA